MLFQAVGCVGWQLGNVGYAPDVQHRNVFERAAKHCLMKSWNQRRTLTTRRHIAAAKVGHHVNARQFRQQGRVVELQGIATGNLAGRVGIESLWTVANGLAVSADGLNAFAITANLVQQGGDTSA